MVYTIHLLRSMYTRIVCVYTDEDLLTYCTYQSHKKTEPTNALQRGSSHWPHTNTPESPSSSNGPGLYHRLSPPAMLVFFLSFAIAATTTNAAYTSYLSTQASVSAKKRTPTITQCFFLWCVRVFDLYASPPPPQRVLSIVGGVFMLRAAPDHACL